MIEDSSILPSTQIGIWIDVRRAVVNGNMLFSLEHDVVIEIPDARVMGSTIPAFEADSAMSLGNEWQAPVRNVEEEPPAAPVWQLGANPIQE